MVLEEDSISLRLGLIEQDYNHFENIFQILEASILENLKSNIEFLRDNHDRFAQFITLQNCNQDCQDYFNTSPDFRNRIANLELLVKRAYRTEMLLFKDKLRVHITELNKLTPEEY